jgi:hypothetical protein
LNAELPSQLYDSLDDLERREAELIPLTFMASADTAQQASQNTQMSSSMHEGEKSVQYNSNHPDAGYPDQLSPSGNFVENSTKLICLETISYRIEYSTVKCYGCLELQIRHGRNMYMDTGTNHKQ